MKGVVDRAGVRDAPAAAGSGGLVPLSPVPLVAGVINGFEAGIAPISAPRVPLEWAVIPAQCL